MKYQLILLLSFLTFSKIQCRSIILDETPKDDSEKSKKVERLFTDDIKDIIEEFNWKNIVESTTNLPWFTLPLSFLGQYQGFSDQTILQLPRRYLKKPTNSDTNLMEQDNKGTLSNDKLSIEEETKMIKTCAEQIDEMLLFIQYVLGQFRKYLNEWCKNHHLMVEISSESSDMLYISPKN